MPIWGQVIIGASLIAGALGVLWRTVLHPVVRAALTAEETLPLLRDLTKEFRDTPHAFAVLDEIVAQFRTDSGSSLRDVVNRLEDVAREHGTSIIAVKDLVAQDHAQLSRLEGVLARLEEAARVVAVDLAASQTRADAADPDVPGASADAAATSEPPNQ